ncbi:MAG TPA: hypothetical protein PJ982_19370, partial [Lacipirellulaceae bacterium]|nr:hypothetical protein [Lacipirellulaceae bacterium]
MTDTAASSAPLSSGPLWKSLRLRLALWNGAVALLVAALALVGLRQGLSWALLREVDQVLVHDAEEISLALSDLRSDELAALKEELVRKAIGHRRRGWYV